VDSAELNRHCSNPSPSVLASVEIAVLGTATRNGLLKTTQSCFFCDKVYDGGFVPADTTNETIPPYQRKKLSDFLHQPRCCTVDAFLAANLVGGTPTARPKI